MALSVDLIYHNMGKGDKFNYLHEDRLDFAGNVIKAGDSIAFISPWYRELTRGKILKLTPKKISIEVGGNGGSTTRYADQVIKISKNGKKG